MKILGRLEESIISILLVLMVLLVFVEVIMRFVFNSGLMWIQELTLLISAWFVLFGASYGLKVGSHIGMDAFVTLFPRTGRRILTGLGAALSLVYCALILYGSYVYLRMMKMIGVELEDIPCPSWIAHSILIIGMSLFAIRVFHIFWSVITGKADSFKHANEAEESMEIVEELKGETL
ncbi:MAG: TRAP transporter small permease [Desulfotalea sp.]